MVDEVDRQIQIKQWLDEHNEEMAELPDMDQKTPGLGKKGPKKGPDKGSAPSKTSKAPVAVENIEDPAHRLKEKLEEIREEDATMSEKIIHAKEAVTEIKEHTDLKKKIYRYEAGIAGAASGSVARICTQPLDVLKIRFQLQVEHISKKDPGAKYTGLWDATKQIIKEENFYALWKGHSPAQLLSTSYGMLQWLTYEDLTKHAWNYSPAFRSEGVQPILHFVCGGIAGCVGTLASSPFDVIRTRLVGQGKPPLYHNTWHAASRIVQEEGVLTFYKGLAPALLQIAPYSGLQFMAYAILTKQWRKKDSLNKRIESGWLASLLCGMLAGLLAKSAIYPLDVAKKRLQVQGFAVARKQFGRTVKYTGLFDCFRVMLKDEGIFSLYKGLLPSCLKAASNTGLNFMLYEKFTHFLHFVESDDFWFDF